MRESVRLAVLVQPFLKPWIAVRGFLLCDANPVQLAPKIRPLSTLTLTCVAAAVR
jgi:hypothetical protein